MIQLQSDPNYQTPSTKAPPITDGQPTGQPMMKWGTPPGSTPGMMYASGNPNGAPISQWGSAPASNDALPDYTASSMRTGLTPPAPNAPADPDFTGGTGTPSNVQDTNPLTRTNSTGFSPKEAIQKTLGGSVGIFSPSDIKSIGDRLFGGGPTAPIAPEYEQAALAQGASSRDVTAQQTNENRPDQYTPWGSSTFQPTTTIDPTTGKEVTTWTQNVNLNPNSQAALTAQQRLAAGRSNLATNLFPQVASDLGTPFTYNGMPAAGNAVNPTTGAMDANAFSADRDKYIQQIEDQIRPEHDIQTEQTRAMLANQGLTPGSEAYNTELRRLSEAQGRDTLGAVTAGNTLQQQLQTMKLANENQQFGQKSTQFGQQNTARTQAIAEELQRRGMSLNDINNLLAGQGITMPVFPTVTPATAAQPDQDLAAAQARGQYQLGATSVNQEAAKNKMGGLGSILGGVGSIAGAFL